MIAQAGESFVNQWFDGYWLVLITKAAIVLIFFLVAPLGVGFPRTMAAQVVENAHV